MLTRSILSALSAFSLALACLSPFSAQAATGDGSPTDENLLYMGRWNKKNPSEPHSYWGGAYIRTGFTGTRISVKLKQKADIVVFIDDKAGVVMKGVSGTVSAATGLASGNHTLKVAARYQMDELVFQGFVLDNGAKTLPAQKSKGIVEFLGNSISSGEKTSKGNVTAFPWLTGEKLGADHVTISFPGITLTDGYHYTYTGAPMIGLEVQYTKLGTPSRYPSTAATSTDDWDFKGYAPDLIVLNIGTNDNSTRVPSGEFKAAYVKTLKLMRGKFPNAHLFGMRTYGGFLAKETEAAVNELAAAGDAKVHYINTAGWLASGDYADDVHPSDAGHAKAVDKLTPILKPYVDGLTTGIAPSAKRGALGRRSLSRVWPDGIRVDGRLNPSPSRSLPTTR